MSDRSIDRWIDLAIDVSVVFLLVFLLCLFVYSVACISLGLDLNSVHTYLR